MDDPYADKMSRLAQRILWGPGSLASTVRQAAASLDDIPEALRSYVQKTAQCAYKITDQDVQALGQAGYSEDQIFELTVSAALGAGLVRLQAGQDALRKGEHDAITHP